MSDLIIQHKESYKLERNKYIYENLVSKKKTWQELAEQFDIKRRESIYRIALHYRTKLKKAERLARKIEKQRLLKEVSEQ